MKAIANIKSIIVAGLILISLTTAVGQAKLAVEDRTPEWRDAIRYALSQSQKYYKKSTFDHFCEPDKQLCTNYIYYPEGDHKIFLREVMGNNGLVFLRDICTFDVYGTIRWCKNFDTGAEREDMKDPNGSWHTVQGSWQ